MFGSKVIEVGVGMALLFLFTSLICAAIREMIEAIMKSRAMDLERGIRTLVNDPSGENYVKSIFDHPLIFSLFIGNYDPNKLTSPLKKKVDQTLDSNSAGPPIVRFEDKMPWSGRSLPSYIPAAQFAAALVDIVARGKVGEQPIDPAQATSPTLFQSFRDAIAKIENPKLQRALLTAAEGVNADLDTVKSNLEKWYDHSMERVAGAYKRRTQIILCCLGLVVAAILNIDAITVARHLSRDDALRKAALDYTEALTNQGATALPTALKDASIDGLRSDIATIGYPIGWENYRPKPQYEACAAGTKGKSACELLPISIAIGWLITAFAVTLGAPFWFDVLSKIMIVRSTKKPASTPATGSN